MTPVRPYEHSRDYERVSAFLTDIYEPEPHLTNWLQPRWEYMHAHPLIVGTPLERIGITEDGGGVVGVVHFEHNPAFVYLQVRPGHDAAKTAMVDWAEDHLGGVSQSLGRPVLGLYVNELDAALEDIVANRGFSLLADYEEEHALLALSATIDAGSLPTGYHLQSLEDENDLSKINRVLWRGFGHEGPPPDSEIPGRARVEAAPNFRRDLTTVAVAPDGEYAAYAGMWHDLHNRVAYVEPVATDPDHRRLGLGAACVRESLRRVEADGAEVAWVGSGLDFYKSMGFEVVNTAHLWVRDL